MVNQEIVKYLQEGIKRGFNISLLRQKLLEGGFNARDVDEAINVVGNVNQFEKKMEPAEKKIDNGFVNESVGFFTKVKKTFSAPTWLFENTKNDGIFACLKYLWLISIVPFVLGSVVVYFLLQMLFSYFSSLSEVAMNENLITMFRVSSITTILMIIAGLGVYLFVIAPIFLFVTSGIIHLFVKLFKGSGKYSDTFRTLVYASTPSVIFMVIPFVNAIAGIWTLVLSIFGLSINHKISKLKAFLVLLVAGLIIGGIVSILFFIISFSLAPLTTV